MNWPRLREGERGERERKREGRERGEGKGDREKTKQKEKGGTRITLGAAVVNSWLRRSSKAVIKSTFRCQFTSTLSRAIVGWCQKT